MTVRRSVWVPALAVLAALALPARPARCEDKPAAPATDAAGQIKQLLADLDTAEKAKDDGALTALAKKVPALYKGTQDAALRKQLMVGLGGLLKNPKLSSARKAALDAIVETDDGKEAWKVLDKYYPDDDVDDPERWNLEVLKGIAALHPDGAIEKLLESFRKAKKPEVSVEAVKALGNYHKSKQREKILEELVKSGRNMVPSKSATANASPETVARWSAISPALGKALDTLTGDSVGDPLEWFKRYNDAKKNVKSLFKE